LIVNERNTSIPNKLGSELIGKKSDYGLSRNIHRHVVVSDINEALSALPRNLQNIPVMSYDPIPPLDSIDIYDDSDIINNIDEQFRVNQLSDFISPQVNELIRLIQ